MFLLVSDLFKPKVIPLIRNQEVTTTEKKEDEINDGLKKNQENKDESACNLSMTSQSGEKTISAATTSTNANTDNLTLLDLISKMQEKLISASASSTTKTPTQHILSNLTPLSKRNNKRQQTYFIKIIFFFPIYFQF